MELIVNKRGNLVRPKPKFKNMLVSASISLATVVVLAILNASDAGDAMDALPWLLLFTALFITLQYIADLSEGEIEFDRRLNRVNVNGRAIAPFKSVQHVLIEEEPTDDGPRHQVTLKIGASRRLNVLRTNSEIDASIAAADIARVVGCEVVVGR